MLMIYCSITGKPQTRITQVKTELGKCFQVKDLGELHHYFLGVNVKQHSEASNIRIGHQSYTILKQFSGDLDRNSANLLPHQWLNKQSY